MEDLEDLILQQLIYSTEFARKVSPFLKEEYFNNQRHKIILRNTLNFFENYGSSPTKEALIIDIENNETAISEDVFSNIAQALSSYHEEYDEVDIHWLVDRTEKFCQDKALYNAFMEGIQVINEEDSSNALSKNEIPKMLESALSVSFDSNIGHDYFGSAEDRYNFYHNKEEKYAFDIDILNRVTKGGVPRGTLNIIMADTGVGKSLIGSHMAANYMMQGSNVLYITLELSEEHVAERVDANLMDIDLDTLHDLPKPQYDKKIQNIRDKTTGNLKVKQYPTAMAHVGHFRHTMKEMKTKEGFIPDAVVVDYLNICASSRYRNAGDAGSYTMVKAIAEEVRGLGVEWNVPVWSFTQVNRSGAGDSDPDLTNTAESYGLPATADFFMVLINNEELEGMNQILWKQLKNRYGPVDKPRRFITGIDRSKMKVYDIENTAQPEAEEIPDKPENSVEGGGGKYDFSGVEV